MKLFFDFLPIVLFFITYKLFDLYVATAVLIVAAFAQLGIVWLKYRKIESMQLLSAMMFLILGGATIILQDELFIKWKPTVLSWLFALMFLGTQFIGKKYLIQRLIENTIKLPEPVWARINASWVVFFTTIGALNLYVVYHYDTNTWVNFKLFGVLGFTIVFMIGLAVYMTRHMTEENEFNSPNNSNASS